MSNTASVKTRPDKALLKKQKHEDRANKVTNIAHRR